MITLPVRPVNKELDNKAHGGLYLVTLAFPQVYQAEHRV